MKKYIAAFLSINAMLLSACASYKALPAPEYVDLDRFMGNWYVIASIPTPFERNIVNATEKYERLSERKIQTTFSYKKGDIDGKTKSMRPVGFVSDDPSNAVWKMQFFWPLKSDYRIVYLDDEYQSTIIGRMKRDYVWILARTPEISDAHYTSLVEKIEQLGYDMSKLSKVPQNWE